MLRKRSSGAKDILDNLRTALDRLLVARIDRRSAGANYSLARLARTIKNLEQEIRKAERRYASELRLGPASEQARRSAQAAKTQWKKTNNR